MLQEHGWRGDIAVEIGMVLGADYGGEQWKIGGMVVAQGSAA
ncbi:hypothetical protein [Arthrobacter sp. ERGS1:01]|nr:hypothetical protein [Arthrobacter sp. ERGS1:01]